MLKDNINGKGRTKPPQALVCYIFFNVLFGFYFLICKFTNYAFELSICITTYQIEVYEIQPDLRYVWGHFLHLQGTHPVAPCQTRKIWADEVSNVVLDYAVAASCNWNNMLL